MMPGRSTLGTAALAVITVLAACGRTRAPAAPTPAQVDSLAAEAAARADSLARAAALAETRPRHALRPVPYTRAFQRALRNGTRTEDGRPGPRYWQQRVDYRIDAEIDPATARVQGVETVVYHNRSPDTLDVLVFHLYQNVFAEGAQRVRRVPITGGMTIERVAVDGKNAGGGGGAPAYDIDGTLMVLSLPRPLAPGSRVSVEIAWHFTVPPAGAPRTGHDRKQAYVVAQWYPQVATYDDIRGWHAVPYWSNAEFYLEYGEFDVAITAPEGWLIGATGALDNPDEVLSLDALDRLAQARGRDDVVNIVTADDHDARDATAREPGGQLTWRFRARNVRDFAFAASNRYLWDATRATLPDADGDGQPETVLVHALYRPSATSWREAASYLKHAVTFHAQWHPYIYPQITAAEGPISGMEYPMVVFIGAPREPQALYEVLSHEVAHQWWSMMVGSNETHYAWQDEGLTTYVENLAVKDLFPRADPFGETMRAYLSIADTDHERPIIREADLYGPGQQYGIATYTKPGTLFRALSAVIGERTLHAALRVYANRWLLKHPSPYDLFNTIEDVAGRKLDWFWYPWFYETAVLDQAIASVDIEVMAGGGERVAVTIEDQGDAPMPVLLAFTTASGAVHHLELPVEPWLEGRVRQLGSIELPERVQRIEIDPERFFPDIDRNDNVWLRQRVGGLETSPAIPRSYSFAR
jgi:hypothetical protein